MKLIEALKLVKDLKRKHSDLVAKIGKYCADRNIETPTYGTEHEQREQIRQWIQSATDIVHEIEKLSVNIAITNFNTVVDIKIGDKTLKKSITAWILRRKELAVLESQIWRALSDKGLTDGITRTSSGETMEIKVRRYYDMKTRDRMIEELTEERSLIDSKLEVVNAVTDLMEV